MSKTNQYNIEHPKSIVYRIIAQKCNQNNKSPNVIIHEPEYSHRYVQIGNKNIFKCSVTIVIDGDQYVFESCECFNKRECDRDVYILIKDFLENNVSNKSETNNIDNSAKHNNIICKSDDGTKKEMKQNNEDGLLFERNEDMTNVIYVIVDIENISKQEQILQCKNLKVVNKDVRVLKIAGFCSTVTQYADIIVRSNRKDAVDHYISYVIGILESGKSCPEIYVISRDKFGSCLQDFCKNVTHCVDVSDFMNVVRSKK